MGFLQQRNWMILVTIMLFYLSGFQRVSGIKCFRCSTPPDTQMGLPEDCEKQKIAIDCPAIADSCRKFSGAKAKGDRKVVQKDCDVGQVNRCNSNVDKMVFGEPFKGDECTCTGDGCNGGNNFKGDGSSFKGELGKHYIMFFGTIFIITGLFLS